jgi:hypothetical protein
MSLTRNELLEQILALTPQSNYDATTNPAVTDDASQGYTGRSAWINTSTGDEFVCTDPTIGAAVWAAVVIL